MSVQAALRKAFERAQPDFPSGTPFWKDPGCRRALQHHPWLREAAAYLPPDLETNVFEGQAAIEALWSSYKDHGYGYLFYGLTRRLCPDRCVELGVLQGFSLLTIASALRDNGRGVVEGFDLFEEYPYHHEAYANVLKRLRTFGLRDRASINRAEASQVHARFDTIDVLHVDLSNTGETYRQIFAQWAGKVKQAIILEGGSPARDRVDWMVTYGKAPICDALDEIRSRYANWEVIVFDPFPSLTLALRMSGSHGT